MTKKLFTLCLEKSPTHILLGMKKRGFGAGRWNGFGGKLEQGETIEQAALREVQEEIGVTYTVLKKVGTLQFYFVEVGEHHEVHVFEGEGGTGEPVETDEMKPQWFLHSEIPYEQMWADDIFWMPYYLQGKKFEGAFTFDSNHQILEKKLIVEGEQVL